LVVVKNAALPKVYPEKFVHFERNATFAEDFYIQSGQLINQQIPF